MYSIINILNKSCIVGILLTTTSIFSAFGDIDHTKLKGINQLLRPEFQYLSPVEGFTLLKTGTLENLYRYGNEDEHTIRLIKLMFHAVDTVNFVPTRLPSRVTAHLTTAGIGALLNQFLSKEENFETRLSEVIYKDLGLDLPPATSKHTGKTRQVLKKSAREFVTELLEAQKETLGPDSKYPPHFPEKILLSFFWLKATNDKSEFLTLFREIPQILKGEGFNPAEEASWLQDQHSLEDYVEELQKFLLKPLNLQGSALVSDPELGTFLAASFDIWEKPLPSIVSYTTTFAKDSETGQIERFSDCGETSMRNFFNIVLKNSRTRKFDASQAVSKAEAKKLNLNTGFLKFYKTHDQVNNLSNPELHMEWAAVVSGLPKVLYKEPAENSYCNMTGGLASVLSVFEQLIFNDGLWETLNRGQQFELIAEFFSRPDFLLQFKADAPLFNGESYGKLDFTVNGVPSFSWHFTRGHFYISQSGHSRSDWRKSLGENLTQALVLQEGSSEKYLGFLSWFIDTDNLVEFSTLLGLKSAAEQQFLLLSLPLEAEATKIFVIERILEKKWERLYPMVQKVLPIWTLDNLELRSKLVNSVLKNEAQDLKGFEGIVSTYLKSLYSEPSLSSELFFTAIDNKLHSLMLTLSHAIPMLTQKKNSNNVSPLHYTIKLEDIEAIEILLNAGANPNESDENRGPALSYAVKKRLLPVVISLLDHGAELEAKDEFERTALHSAASGNHLEIAKLLISRGASLKIEDKLGKTPLDLALESEHEEMVKFFLNSPEPYFGKLSIQSL